MGHEAEINHYVFGCTVAASGGAPHKSWELRGAAGDRDAIGPTGAKRPNAEA